MIAAPARRPEAPEHRPAHCGASASSGADGDGRGDGVQQPPRPARRSSAATSLVQEGRAARDEHERRGRADGRGQPGAGRGRRCSTPRGRPSAGRRGRWRRRQRRCARTPSAARGRPGRAAPMRPTGRAPARSPTARTWPQRVATAPGRPSAAGARAGPRRTSAPVRRSSANPTRRRRRRPSECRRRGRMRPLRSRRQPRRALHAPIRRRGFFGTHVATPSARGPRAASR